MKNTNLISLLFVLVLGFFGNKVAAVPTNKYYHAVSVDTSIYTILKFSKANTFTSAFDKNDKAAVLSTNEIAEVEKLIASAVAKHNKSAGKYDQINNPLKYYKDLVAVVNHKREKKVYVICFCSTPGTKWKKQLGHIRDFELVVNLTKNTFYRFIVNGTV